MAMKRTLKLKWDAFKRGISCNVSCRNETYLQQTSLYMQVPTLKKPTKNYKSYKCKEKLRQKSNLDEERIVLLLVHLSQMTLPTIIFLHTATSWKLQPKQVWGDRPFSPANFIRSLQYLHLICFLFILPFKFPLKTLKDWTLPPPFVSRTKADRPTEQRQREQISKKQNYLPPLFAI